MLCEQCPNVAATVAEKVGCPLYSINAQDLGEGPAAISSSFAKIMENAAEWNALVLLDGTATKYSVTALAG